LRELGEITDARREWRFATRGLTNTQQYSAAHYAYELDWYSQAIRSAIAAERWDDLKLRFPPAHEQTITQAAETRDLQANWLLAMARQESAMDPLARSPKGAVGLLQLMPSTAKAVARKHGYRYRNTTTLLDPQTNAKFGATYLRQLATQFDGNMIYATAAYNAGPHRVNGWLENNDHLPIDVWIENIPYSETRQYVKNVLAYSVIYAHQRQQPGFRMATAQFGPVFTPAIATAPPEQGCQPSAEC
jgi:soluble lytic murein transglycosylase